MKTVTSFTVNTSIAALRLTSNVSSLVEYLKYLHLLAETFGIQLKKKAPLAVEIKPAIERLELVCQFYQECVDNVKIVSGKRASRIEDERGLFKLLREIKVLLDRFNPGLSTRFNINSILTLVVDWKHFFWNESGLEWHAFTTWVWL